MGPSITHLSAINASMMSETVLRCRPERRARSAREIGWPVRIRFKTIRRLISRAVSFEAARSGLRLTCRTGTPIIAMLGASSRPIKGVPQQKIFVDRTIVLDRRHRRSELDEIVRMLLAV